MCIRDRANTDKTKVMITTQSKTSKPEQFEIEPLNLEIVNQFKYLGCWMAEDTEGINEIRKRMQAPNRAYASLTTIFKTKNIHH